MIETFSGNSHAQQGEREYQKRGCCDSFEDINWCTEFDCICDYNGEDTCSKDCGSIQERLRCTKCGSIFEI